MPRAPFRDHHFHSTHPRSLTWDGQAPEGDVDVVLPGGEGNVLHATAAIFVVLTRHFGLGGTLDGQTETPSTSPPVEGRQGGGEVMNGFIMGSSQEGRVKSIARRFW